MVADQVHRGSVLAAGLAMSCGDMTGGDWGGGGGGASLGVSGGIGGGGLGVGSGGRGQAGQAVVREAGQEAKGGGRSYRRCWGGQ